MEIWLNILIFIIGVSIGLSVSVLFGIKSHMSQSNSFQTVVDSQLRRIKHLEYDLERVRGYSRKAPNRKKSYRPRGSQKKGHAK
jgi:hypothetical protein